MLLALMLKLNNSKIMRYAIILLSAVILTSCAVKTSENKISKIIDEPVIQKPEKPKLLPVDFIKKDNNYCLDETNAKKLIYNINALNMYIEFLENTIDMNNNKQEIKDTENK